MPHKHINDPTMELAPPDTSRADTKGVAGPGSDSTIDLPPSEEQIEEVKAGESNSEGKNDLGAATLDYPPGGPLPAEADPVGFTSTVDFLPGAIPAAASPEGELGAATLDYPLGRMTRSGARDNTLAPGVRGDAPSERKLVANYEIIGELGRGGMGVVYKARQLGLNRLVALKMVIAGAHASEQQLARFYIEAEAVAGLQHPNIVQIYEVGKHEDLPYFSLEYVDGGSLDGKVKNNPQPPREAAQVLLLLAQGMACAHKLGIIHRDLKPANVLLTKDGVPKITDFGLAKRLESDSSQTKSGTLMGTPNYMAPEQAGGKTHDVGPLSDQYSLGAVLYEMLTGRPPLVGTTILETLDLVQNKEPLPPSHLQPGVPRDLETICLKCLQKEPAKRYATTDDLAEDLGHFLAGEPIKARPVSRLERTWRWCRRNPKISALTAAIILLVLATGGALTALWINSAREERATQDRLAREQKAIDETFKLTQERLEQARAAIAVGNHQQAATLLATSDPLLDRAPQLEEIRGQVRTLQLQVELYAEFKKLLDNARFASRFGSPRQKEQAQKYCRELVELDGQLKDRQGRAAAGLPPLNAEQQSLFQEDRFEVYLIAALIETDLASTRDNSVKEEAARRSLDWLNRADQVLPGLRVTYANRSHCWGVLGNKAEDDADVKRALAIVPTSAVDHFWHGFAHHLRADEARRKGDQQGAQGFLRQEIAEYAALVQQRPDHFWGYFNWANCQVELGNLPDAQIGFTACIRIRPDFPWPYNNRATIHFRLGEFEQALQDYNAALAHSTDYMEAFANRGLVHFKLDKMDPALADLNRAIALGSDYAQAYEFRSDVFLRKKEYAAALADLEKLLTFTKDRASIYLKMADVHHSMGRDDDAVSDCTQAVTENPKNIKVIYKRAGFLVARKEYPLAVQDYSAVLALVPKALEPRQDRANVYWVYLKDFDASIADWEELARLYPKNPDSFFSIGVIKLGRRQYDDARESLQKAVDIKPDSPVAIWALAQIAYWQGGLDEALKIINPLAEKLPAKYPETLNVRGDIYRALGRLDDAAADYRRLISLKPDLVETYASLALVYEKQGKPDLEKECFDKLVAANPNSPRAYLQRAVHRRTRGQYDAAREDCAQARIKDPKSVLPGLVEAGILAAQGSAEEAVTKAVTLLSLAPKGDGHILYEAACTWSLASQAAAALPDKNKAMELKKRYADRAAALLSECLDKGFHDLVYPEHNRMIDDPALEPIRSDPRVLRMLRHLP